MITIARFPSQKITADEVDHLVETLENKTVRKTFDSFIVRSSFFSSDSYYTESFM